LLNLHKILPLFLIFPLTAGVLGIVANFDFLRSTRLAGPVIMAMVFLIFSSVALYVQMSWEFNEKSPSGDVIGSFFAYLFQFCVFILIFFSVTWIILSICRLYLPPMARQAGFLSLWLGWVTLNIHYLMLLSERGVIGPRKKK